MKPLIPHVPNVREVHCEGNTEEKQKTRCPSPLLALRLATEPVIHQGGRRQKAKPHKYTYIHIYIYIYIHIYIYLYLYLFIYLICLPPVILFDRRHGHRDEPENESTKVEGNNAILQIVFSSTSL